MFCSASSTPRKWIIKGEKDVVFQWKTTSFSPLKSPCRAAAGGEVECKQILFIK